MYGLPAALTAYSLLVAYLVLLLLPGAAIARLLRTWRVLHPLAISVIVFGTLPLLGYLAFWIFLADRWAGRIFCCGVYAGSTALLLATRPSKQFWSDLVSAVRRPVLLVLSAALLYLSSLWLYGGEDMQLANMRFFNTERPADNLIPLIFADKIYSRQPLRPFCCGDWLSSDRPPLQTGVVLILRPLRLRAAGNIHYQIVATLLQCLAFAAAWSLLRASGITSKVRARVITLLIFSGFFFYNGVYAWPKLLAAAFILFAFAIFARTFRQRQALTATDAVLAGCSVSLALLAHPGSVFGLPAMSLAVFWNGRLLRVRSVVFAVIPPLLLLSSWAFYQLRIDPPGNRLAKMHLAGVNTIDDRPLLQTLEGSYTQRSIGEMAHNKSANFLTLFGTDPLFTSVFAGSEEARIVQREYIWSSLGLLELGWAAVIIYVIRKRKARKGLQPILWLLAAAIFNFCVWSLALFGPGATFTTHSSYADILLLALSLAVFVVATLPWPCLALLTAWQLYKFYFTWVLPKSSYMASAPLNISFLAGALAVTILLLWFGLIRPSERSDRAAIAETEPAPLPVP